MKKYYIWKHLDGTLSVQELSDNLYITEDVLLTETYAGAFLEACYIKQYAPCIKTNSVGMVCRKKYTDLPGLPFNAYRLLFFYAKKKTGFKLTDEVEEVCNIVSYHHDPAKNAKRYLEWKNLVNHKDKSTAGTDNNCKECGKTMKFTDLYGTLKDKTRETLTDVRVLYGILLDLLIYIVKDDIVKYAKKVYVKVKTLVRKLRKLLPQPNKVVKDCEEEVRVD